MYKSKSFRDIQREAGVTRTPSTTKPTVTTGITNNRWNKRSLPKGASRKTNGKTGGQRTGR